MLFFFTRAFVSIKGYIYLFMACPVHVYTFEIKCDIKTIYILFLWLKLCREHDQVEKPVADWFWLIFCFEVINFYTYLGKTWCAPSIVFGCTADRSVRTYKLKQEQSKIGLKNSRNVKHKLLFFILTKLIFPKLFFLFYKKNSEVTGTQIIIQPLMSRT